MCVFVPVTEVWACTTEMLEAPTTVLPFVPVELPETVDEQAPTAGTNSVQSVTIGKFDALRWSVSVPFDVLPQLVEPQTMVFSANSPRFQSAKSRLVGVPG